MRKLLLVISLLALFASLVLCVNAHPGRTDSKGGHTDRSTGEYHYHHGYSAHSHYDMDGDGAVDCPYNFEDKTNHKPSSSKSKAEDKTPKPTTEPTASQTTKSEKTSGLSFEFVLKIVIAVAVIGFWILPIFFNNKK